ncbi:DUF2207 domain-containing protein [Achromobacter aloeverae]|uniref:DUF2207 domain-containing protein n=1 Tax=Achromobacter aloeverae TaxID=1750518 RepID=A0A4Q1HEW3_9BURK|nr:DUF2207 domain-containing protein [Achromobacter aloeverae]RXN85139.1 hypothetical protein C7R54_21750 [Achromobacter aloeverae]
MSRSDDRRRLSALRRPLQHVARHARPLTAATGVETPRRRRLLPWMERRDPAAEDTRRGVPMPLRVVLGIIASVVATVMAVLLLATPANAQSTSDPGEMATRAYPGREFIIAFESDIDVQRDGDLLVTERIAVNALGREIKRGVVRDFPTLYRSRDGLNVRVGFDVLGVDRDGKPEPYALEKQSNGVRIRIGDPDRWLAPGTHVYEIRYRTTRQLGFYQDHDELYWNVTGNGWTMPIAHAVARIHLPEDAPVLRTAFYTGPQGATDKNARVVESKPGEVTFENTVPLRMREGLTIAVSWPKGIVQAPSRLQGIYYQLRDNLAALVAVAGFILLAAYYIVVHGRTRRRAHAPAHIVPLYEPPEGMSAPAVRYMARKGNDERGFVIGVIELIALRALRIDRDDGKRGTGRETRFVLLQPDAQGQRGMARDTLLGTLLHKMFGAHTSFYRSSAGSARLRDARATLSSSLDNLYSGYIADHGKRARRGLWLWLLYLAACIYTLVLQGGEVGGTLASLPFLAVGLGVLAITWAMVRSNFSWGPVVFCLLFGVPFLLGGIGVLAADNAVTPVRALSALLPALMLPVVVRAFRFLRGYTEEGHEIMDRIAGFKQYLTLAEGPRLEALATVDEKLRLYERYLPYAVALDVGKRWAAAFAGLAATVAGAAAVQAMQDMYGGHDFYRDAPGRALSGIGSDVTPPPISSSSGSPGTSGSWSGSSDSSSSGSFDSGSSGDGGGGGGGSGW